MHSSRMRTDRAFTVCRSLLLVGCVPGPGGRGVYLVPGECTWSGGGGVPAWSWGVYLVPGGWGCTCLVPGVYLPGPGGVPAPEGVYLVPGGVPGPGGSTWSGTPPVPGQVLPPPVDRMTHAYKKKPRRLENVSVLFSMRSRGICTR